jgi:hypothetical protein
MFNADLHAPARWRLRAASIGAGALLLTAGPMAIAWAPTAMAAEPKPAPAPKPEPAPKDPKPAPAPKDNTSTASDSTTTSTTTDSGSDGSTAPASTPTDDKAAKQAADQQAKLDKQAADQVKKDAKAAADQQKKADEQKAKLDKQAADQAKKDGKNNPPTTPAPDPGNTDTSTSGGGDVTTPTTPADTSGGLGSNPGQSNPGNNGDNGNHGQGNNGNGNGGVGAGNNGDNGNHGQGNNGNGNGGVGAGNNGGNGNHGQGNNGKAVGHQNAPVTSVVFNDVMPGPTTGPEGWMPFASSDSGSTPLSVLLLGPAASLVTSGSSSENAFALGQTHVLGEKFQAPSETAPLSASAMLKAFDKKAKAKAPRVKAQPEEFSGTALSSSNWHSAGTAIPLLALLLLAEMLVLGRRLGNKVRGTRSESAAAAPRVAGQVRWA